MCFLLSSIIMHAGNETNDQESYLLHVVVVSINNKID